MKKPKVMEQVPDLNMIGGLTSEFNALKNSSLNQKFEFIPLVLPKVHRKINFKDISYYYKAIKKEKPDIVQIRGAGIDGLNAEIAAKLVPGTKILLCIHGMLSEADYIPKYKYFLYRYIIEPFAFILADGISCVYKGGNERKQLRQFRKKLLPYIYNRMPEYKNMDKNIYRRKVRNELNISSDSIVGIFCGRITYGKGLTYLFDTFKNMRSTWPEKLKFIFVGDGDYLEILQNLSIDLGIEDKVKFTGAKKQVYKYLCAADFYIFPSLHENHSIALLEAIAMQLPVIATNVGGNPEIIRDGIEGLLCPKGNPEALEYCIRKLTTDEGLFKRIRSNILRTEYSQFTNEAVDKQLENVLNAMLN